MRWHELTLSVRRDQLEAASALLFELGCAGIQEDVPAHELRSAWEPRFEGPLRGPSPSQPSCSGSPQRAAGACSPAGTSEQSSSGLPQRAAGAPPPEGSQAEAMVLRVSFEDPDRERVAAGLAGIAPQELAWRILPDVDWSEAWKAEHRALKLSPRIVVAPPWDAPPGALVIEPGQGFGTGQHPTTGMVARALDGLADEVHTLLDVGCGSGLLALAGAQLGLRAHGIDVQPEAVEEARLNAERNALAATFATTPLAELEQRAELVVANVHAEILLQLAPDLVRLTERWLVLGGILADREARVREAFADLEQVGRSEEGKWISLTYRRG